MRACCSLRLLSQQPLGLLCRRKNDREARGVACSFRTTAHDLIANGPA